MIEHAKITEMLQAEVAADSWWNGLTPREKKAYIKAHPRSKYARSSSKAPPTRRVFGHQRRHGHLRQARAPHRRAPRRDTEVECRS